MEQLILAYASYQQDGWSKWLSHAEFAYNTMVHASAKLFPFITVYHKEPIHPLIDTAANSAKLWPEATEVVEKMKNVSDIVKSNMAETQARQKLNYDKKKKDMSYQVGDCLLLNSKHVKTSRPSKKLDGK